MYVGDFNCQHVNWSYYKTSPDGESLDSWATSNSLGLLHDQKKTASSFSHLCNVSINPDLVFASFGQDNRLLDSSDGVSRLGLGLETRLETRFLKSVSISKVSGLVSVSKDFGLGLELFVSRLYIG